MCLSGWVGRLLDVTSTCDMYMRRVDSACRSRRRGRVWGS